MVSEIFPKPKPIIGVVQLFPLPGSPGWEGDMGTLMARAEQEATALTSGGVDGLLIENTYDAPHRKDRIDVSGAIAMSQVAHRIQHFTDLPLGVSVLHNDPETALAIALAVGASFIRVPVLVGTMIREEGMVGGKLNELCAYRNMLKGSERIQIVADVTMNHIVPAPQLQAPWKAPMAYLNNVTQAIRKHGVADAIIVSEREVSPENLREIRSLCDLPVWVGDEFSAESIAPYHQAANGLILAKGIQKTPVSGLDQRCTVDMPKVENLLRNLHSHSPL